MKKSIVFLLLLAAYIQACQKADNNVKPDAVGPSQASANKNMDASLSQIKRGEYLVTIADCNACHSPKIMTEFGPEPDPSRLLSGHPAGEKVAAYDPKIINNWILFNHNSTASVGPWGVSYSGNLTSDETGIGLWSEEQFILALRKGKLKGLENGRPLLPPMPWPNYAQMKDDDLKAIFAYLKSIKPVHNIVPPPVLQLAGSMH